MTEAKKDAVTAAVGDVPERMKKEEEQGFLGIKTDPRPNSDYSLVSGPSSPTVVDDDQTRVAQPEPTKGKK